MNEKVRGLKDKMEQDLKQDILPFWMDKAADPIRGGYYGEILNDGTVREEAPRCLILTARLIWTFSAAYRILKEPRYLEAANRAHAYFMKDFWDTTYDGAYYLVDVNGKPLDAKKFVYGQAFVIYALSEHYRATGHQDSLDKAVVLFKRLEDHAYDQEHQGYIEALDTNWDNRRLLYRSNINPTEGSKTMNTHLHLLEAYTNLTRVWRTPEVLEKLKGLITVMTTHILDAQTAHFKLYFTDDWQSLSDEVSFGHDIEGSWLLLEAAEVLGDPEVLKAVKPLVLGMAEAALTEGMDPDGAMEYEADAQGVIIDSRKSWWVQAEAIAGFYNAYQLSGEARYFEAALGVWRYVEDHLIDREQGDWFSYAHDKGDPRGVKVSGWKCPYHNARACFEIIERVN